VDLYHPIQLACGPGATALREDFRHDTDMYETHRYLHGTAPMTTPLETARKSRPIADKDRKPYFGVPMSRSSSATKGLTYAEQRCQTYLGVIGGWRGIFWFAGRHQYRECWDAIKKVAGELKELGPILLAEEVAQDVRVVDSEENPIYWTLFEHEGKRYILAANARDKPASATFTLPGIGGDTPVNVWFEDRKLKAIDGAFRDDFAEYGVHVYEIVSAGRE